jgi:membrane protein implicated in regulation of membrane protease activity
MPDLYTSITWVIALTAFLLGAQLFGVTGALLLMLVGTLLIAVVATVIGSRARRRLERRDPRFVATDEVFRDPASGEQMRVHADPSTGERRYWKG